MATIGTLKEEKQHFTKPQMKQHRGNYQMRIEREVKLDYSDVLFRPKRSAMLSRRNVVLERSYQFKNSKRHYTGIPIIASNMHGVGTYEMVLPLAKKNMFTCLSTTY